MSIIDCFSPHYAFDDKVLKFKKDEYIKKGYTFYEAKTFSDIHTANNSSWYRFRKICENEEKNQYRIPHRTIYDTLSILNNFSSEEQYLRFLRHVIISEKSYSMITMIVEPKSIDYKIKLDLMRMSDYVIDVNDKGECALNKP